MNMAKESKNLILYGVPGTGKTYNTIKKALEIIEGRTIDNEDYENLLKKFDEYKTKKQIEFITFHQSYSYEEFVEGIKPVLEGDGKYEGDEGGDEKNNNDNRDNNTLKYELKDGIFKKIVNIAKNITVDTTKNNINNENDTNTTINFDEKTKFYKMSLGRSGIDNNIYDYCIKNNVIAIGYAGDTDFSKLDYKNEKEVIEELKKEKYNYTPQKQCAMKNFVCKLKKGDIIIISDGMEYFQAIAKITGDYEYRVDNIQNDLYPHCREVEYILISKNNSLPYYTIQQRMFSRHTIYQLDTKNLSINNLKNLISSYNHEEKSSDNDHSEKMKYVLIIDEINRGNISKIFGELITLIEDDKRRKEWAITLPYSNEPFYVPDNLYIIGTMNTTDRSIAQIDIALRRRFRFIPYYTNYTLISENIYNINLRKLLKTINNRISAVIDKDHEIGHAYFMNLNDIQDIKDVWFNKILPLLNEYCYGDWDNISYILGENLKNTSDTGFIKKTTIDKEYKIYEFKSENEVENDKFISYMQLIYSNKNDTSNTNNDNEN